MESDNANLEIRYLQAVNYHAGAQIYLQDNVTLREPLKPEHIKDRLLGYWGTCPGINLIYAHLFITQQTVTLRAMAQSGSGILSTRSDGLQ
jgi:phosphoketolase